MKRWPKLMLSLKDRWRWPTLDRKSRRRYAAFLKRILREKRPKLVLALCFLATVSHAGDARKDCDSSFLTVDPDNGIGPRIEILTRVGPHAPAAFSSHVFASRARCRETLAVIQDVLGRVKTSTTVRIQEFNCEPPMYGDR